MTRFAGMVSWISVPGARVRDRFTAVIARHDGTRRPTVRQTQRALFVQDGRAPPPLSQVTALASARLDNPNDVAASLGVSPATGDAHLVVRALQRDGDAGLARLLGGFCVAHWDERAATLTLARDCMGERSIFYSIGDGFVAFASHLADLLALPMVPRELDEAMLAHFLALNHHDRDRTFYRAVRRVPSRSVLLIDPGAIQCRHYWSPRRDAFEHDPAAAVARARELFDRAVARSLRGTSRVAILTSGGLDSSALAATAARLATAQIDCYTGVPPGGLERPPRPGRYLDERAKVEALARRHPALNLRFVTPLGAHLRQSEPTRFFPDLPLPHRNVCNLGWFAQIDEAIAADGHSRILHGAVGNMTLTWSGGFSLASQLASGHWAGLLRDAQAIARAQNRRLARLIAGEALMPLMPDVVHEPLQRLRGLRPGAIGAFSLLRNEAVERLDLRRQWRRDAFDATFMLRGESAQLRAHLIFDHFQLARDIFAMGQIAGDIEVRDPYCDRELVEFALSVPETLFRRDGVARWLARQVFADRLPAEILNETRRGEQAPNWFESLNARKAAIEGEAERIEASPLATRLIDTRRLRQLIARWPRDAREAQARETDYRYALDRAVHAGRFIRWVEGANA